MARYTRRCKRNFFKDWRRGGRRGTIAFMVRACRDRGNLEDSEDLYCLHCGYNVRGLPGDPVRCPECGNDNAINDLEVPSKLIRRALRALETGAALCGASTATLALFVLPFSAAAASVYLDDDIILYVWSFLFAVTLACAGALVAGMRRFRASCGGNPQWRNALLGFVCLSCLIAALAWTALAMGVICIAMFFFGVGLPRPVALLLMVVAYALFAAGVLIYQYARRSIHRLQRETAARLARSRWMSVEPEVAEH